MRKPAKRVSHDVAYPDTAPKRGSVWLDKAYLGHYALCGRIFVLDVVSSQLFVLNGAVSSAGHVRSLMQSLKFSLRKTDYVGCTRFSETINYKQQDNPTFHNALRAPGHAICHITAGAPAAPRDPQTQKKRRLRSLRQWRRQRQRQ
jgi:hypothetical protein